MDLTAVFEPGNFNLRNFHNTIKTEAQAQRLALQLQLYPEVLRCPDCDRLMGRKTGDNYKLGWRFICKRAGCNFKRTVNPLKNTFFEKSKLKFTQVFDIVIHWVSHDSVTSTGNLYQHTDETMVNWYSFCREVARIADRHDTPQIGGPTDIVEVDESHLFNRKYNRGRILTRKIWVFGGISRLTKKVFVERVNRRTREVLFPIMVERIAPNTFIFADEWRAYRTCPQLGFRGYAAVNHSQHFVRPGYERMAGVPTELGDLVPGTNVVQVKVRSTPTTRDGWLVTQ